MKTDTLMKEYLQRIEFFKGHDKLTKRMAGEGKPLSKAEIFWHLAMIDFRIRECIGKTDDIHVSLCSHDAIITRELGTGFCRVCHRQLNFEDGLECVARYNDYLVIRNERCPAPICCDCAKNNPDEFHMAFKEGISMFKTENEMLMGR